MQPKNIIYTRPPLFPYQTALLNSKARFTVCIASTKVGKTACHIVWMLEEGLKLKENQSGWWIAPTFNQAKIAYDRMKTQISDKRLFTYNDTNLIITLVTGGKLQFKTGEKPDNLYGDDVYFFIYDEFSRGREESWFALRSTISSTGGRGKFIGNAKGSKNWGYKLAMRAKAGNDKDFEYHKITAYDAADAGMKTKDGRPFIEEIEAAKRDLPEYVFNELYLAEASEDGSNPFGLKFIEMCCHPTISPRESVCYGIDLARKVDWVSIIGLDKLGAISHHHTFTKIGWQTTIDTIKMLPKKPMAMDSTGVGDVVVSQVEIVQQQLEPYIFTQASKQMLMEGLAVGIQSRQIIIPDDGDPVNGTGRIRHQLEQFEILYTRTGVKYSAPEGEHDDDVCALALAFHKWKTASKEGEISIW